MTATYTRYWISDGWILHPDPAKSAKYWISGKWIWGPVGTGNANTGHWISEGYIWVPLAQPRSTLGFTSEMDTSTAHRSTCHSQTNRRAPEADG